MPDHDAKALAVDAALDDWTDLHGHTDWAAAAALDIVADLHDRSGFDGVFDHLGEELTDDVLDSIETIVGAAYLGHERTIRGRRYELVAEIIRVSGDRAREYQRLGGELGDKLGAAEAEVVRLRDILRVMSRHGFGLDQNATAEESSEYWYRQTERLRGMARGALAAA